MQLKKGWVYKDATNRSLDCFNLGDILLQTGVDCAWLSMKKCRMRLSCVPKRQARIIPLAISTGVPLHLLLHDVLRCFGTCEPRSQQLLDHFVYEQIEPDHTGANFFVGANFAQAQRSSKLLSISTMGKLKPRPKPALCLQSASTFATS